MKLETDTTNDVTILTVTDTRIDAAVAIQFKDAMRTATNNEADRVVLNMSKVKFVDSSGLGAIVAAMKHMGAGRKLDLAGLTADVDKVFRLTRMDSVFDIYPSVEDAVDIRAAG
ncbi:STAS domain-containing protein [Roseovarius sp. 2305UL8-3]|uniref:STAS domain-containing protein n=1 Tax=Roseovarius conchicola TaxID=3121636 RepID=UPI00352767F8